MGLEHHGVTMAETKPLGQSITPASTGIIAMLAKGKRVDNEAAANYVVVQNLAEAKKYFEGDILKYLTAIFYESSGPVLAKALAKAPTKTEVEAMHTCVSDTGLIPNILVCPEKSSEFPEALAMHAKNFGALALIDLAGKAETPSTNPYCYYLWSNLRVNDEMIPAACSTAGLLRSYNFWESPSNKVFSGVTGIETPVQWALNKQQGSDLETEADKLNKENKTVFINVDGIRPWGNRMGGTSGNGQFLSVYRLKNAISESISKSMQWAIDENISKPLIMAVLESVNNYLRDLKSQGAILGGSCTAPSDKNPPDKVKEGKVSFDYEFTPTYPAEQITFTMSITDERLKEVFNV